ncbi:MAG: TlpA family protein disulfide reductase [Fimbriimonadaceae bacterium]|nr:TlpA family protein disulfide reductase [Chitinophagales bacterium]
MNNNFPTKNKLLLAVTFVVAFSLSGCITEKVTSGTKLGNKAPEIISNGIDGKTLKLSDSKGKMVLLEFWCATSPDCRKNHNELKRQFNSKKNSDFKKGDGLTIFSVGLDGDKSIWADAIQQDELSWKNHVNDFKGWNSDAVIKYEVNTLPKYYLIDGDGIVIHKNILAKDLDKILNSYLD